MKRRTKDNGEIECKLYSKSTELPPAWDIFLPDGHALKSADLEVSEQANLSDITSIYALLCNSNGPVAAVYFQVLTLNKHHLNKEMVKAAQYLSWGAFASLVKPKLLIAGHLFRHDICSFYSATHLTPFVAYQCYQQAIDSALERSCAAAVLVKDMAEDLVPYFQHHAPEFLLLRNDISMEMDIPDEWSSVHDYEKALKHKYAQRMRKVRQVWPSLEVKELSATEVSDQKEKLYELYLQVTEHQKVRMGFLSPAFIVGLKNFYGERLKVWAIYEKDKMIAFISAWSRTEVFDMFYIGFDYDRNADLQLYFNILFLSIEQALALGKKKLVLGRTALDAKARLGCRARYLHTFLYIRNKYIRNIVLRAQQNISIQEEGWEERHPLKPLAANK